VPEIGTKSAATLAAENSALDDKIINEIKDGAEADAENSAPGEATQSP